MACRAPAREQSRASRWLELLKLLQVGVVFFLQDEAGFADTDLGAGLIACQCAGGTCGDGPGVVAAVDGAFRPQFDRMKVRVERSGVKGEVIRVLCALEINFDRGGARSR